MANDASLEEIYEDVLSIRKRITFDHKAFVKRHIPHKIVDLLNALDNDIDKVKEKYMDTPNRSKATINKFICLWEIHKPIIRNVHSFKNDTYSNQLVDYLEVIYNKCRVAINIITGDELDLIVGNVILEEGLTTCGEVVKYFNKFYTFRFNARELKVVSSNFHCE